MSGPEPGLETLLDGLEAAIGRLAEGRAALDELVATHEEAARLLAQASSRLAALAERAGRVQSAIGEAAREEGPEP